MTRRVHVPERSCVGCGKRSPQLELVRFVSAAGALELDPERVRAGRGAYLHPAPGCWDAFSRRKPGLRSLRRSVNRTQRTALIAQLREALVR